jgi:hypothetical protein
MGFAKARGPCAVHAGGLPQYSLIKADIAMTFVHDVERPFSAGRGSHHEAHDLCTLVICGIEYVLQIACLRCVNM